MVQQVNYNGKIIAADQALFTAKNRGFKYGDGLFETIRVFEGKIPFLDYHYDRLHKGFSILKFDIPNFYSIDFFRKEIFKLTNGKGNHRIRVSIFRSEGGFYTPSNNHSEFLIENELLQNSSFQLNEKGLRIAIFEAIKITHNIFSPLKTCNSLPYILAGIYCKK